MTPRHPIPDIVDQLLKAIGNVEARVGGLRLVTVVALSSPALLAYDEQAPRWPHECTVDARGVRSLLGSEVVYRPSLGPGSRAVLVLGDGTEMQAPLAMTGGAVAAPRPRARRRRAPDDRKEEMDVRLLAIDPGSSECAWARVDEVLTHNTLVAFVDAGKRASTYEAMCDLLDDEVHAVAVERPEGVHARNPMIARSIGAALIDTAWPGGGFAWIAQARGIRVLEIKPRDWRKALCGIGRGDGGRFTGTKGDDDVRRAVEANVINMPKRTNEHVRDALGIALVVMGRLRSPKTKPLEQLALEVRHG